MGESLLNMAARLGNPWGDERLEDFSESELGAMGRLLMRDKVSLVGLRSKFGEAVDASPLAPLIREDHSAYRAQREEFESIRKLLHTDGVAAMLFKSAGLAPSFHYLSSNLDVIVPPGMTAAARRRLVELGYVELLNVEEPKKYLFRRFPGDGTTFAFHLHEQVGWGVPFLDGETLWDNARKAPDDQDILIPGPAQALLINLAHWFYEDKGLSLGGLFQTAQALYSIDDSLKSIAHAAERRGWEDGYWGALYVFGMAWRSLFGRSFYDKAQWRCINTEMGRHRIVRESIFPRIRYSGDQVAELPFALNKFIYYQKILRDRARSGWNKAHDVTATLLWAVRWKLHVRSQRPILIALGGLDGSGKTIQAERLQDVFDTCDLRNTVIWARGASSRTMSVFIKLGKALLGRVGDLPGEATEGEKMVSRRENMQNPLARFLFSVVYALELSWTWCVKVRLSLWMGKVVICDRYVNDAIVDYASLSGASVDEVPVALRWLAWFVPRPAVTVLLDVTEQEALRRKPDEGSIEHLTRARIGFRKLAAAQGHVIMPGDLSIAEIQRRIVRLSLDQFYARYGTLLNGLLCSNPAQLNPEEQRR